MPFEELEQRIAASLQRGDVNAAVSDTIKGYGPQILGYLRTLIRDHEDAADVFSQFAEDLVKGMGGFRGECSVRVWAYKLAWHAASRFSRDPYRRRRDRLATSMASRLAESVLSSDHRHLERRSAEVERLRVHLSPEEQSLLVLRLDRRLSWREVAEVVASGAEEAGGDGDGRAGPRAPDEVALRKRFERLKDKMARLARQQGLLKPPGEESAARKPGDGKDGRSGKEPKGGKSPRDGREPDPRRR